MKQMLCSLSIIFLLSLSGCIAKPEKQKVEDFNNLTNAHIDLKQDGSVQLVKEYTKKDENGSTTTAITEEKILKREKPYERVPLFDRAYKKQLSIKGKRKQTISVKGEKVKVSVEAIPLHEFVDLMLGSVLKLNYTVSNDVKKMNTPITLNMQNPQKANIVYEVVKKILSLNGVVIKMQNGVLFVQKSSDGKITDTNFGDIYVGYGRSLPRSIDDDKMVYLFVPYNYISPGNTVNLLRQMGIKKLQFYYILKNIQMMKGKASQVRKALELIELIDRPYLNGKIPYLISFENTDVIKFMSQMKEIFRLNGVNVTTNPSQGGITMTAIKDLNMLYVITPKKAWLDMLLYWKNKLDIITDTTEEPRLYIYHVRNRKADELASAIKEVLGLSQKQSKTVSKKKRDTVKQKTKTVAVKNSSGNLLIKQADYTPTVTADLDTNILMLKLTPKHYRILLPFIEELDVLPLQTLVEVTVADVELTDSFSLGFEYAITNDGKNLPKTLLNITGGGSGLGIVFNGNTLDATINAYAEKKLLDIVSRPKILILNNATGSINVGKQVPIVSSEVSATDISTTQPTINRNISYRNTGITLGLTPTINSQGVLTMKIAITLSEAQLNDTSGIDSPLIVNRTLNTIAVIKSGDAILLGGLISQNKSKTKGGIPLLKDIPWIGNIFASNSIKTAKTELIMIIRPVIIRTPQQLSSETYKYKHILKEINFDQL